MPSVSNIAVGALVAEQQLLKQTRNDES